MENRIKLLVMDDEVRFLNTLTQRLSLRDFDVTPACSGRHALALAESWEFDLVLLDLELLGKNRREVLEALEAKHPLTGVILLTRHGANEPATDRSPAGAYMCLQKPAETAELLRVLKAAYQARIQRKLAISESRLRELANISQSESPLSALRKLKELDASR